MDYEKGYVFDLMEQGGPTDVREPYFKDAVDEMMRARVLCAKANACMPDDPSYVGYLEELFGRKLDDVRILTPFICDFRNRVKFGKGVFIRVKDPNSFSGGDPIQVGRAEHGGKVVPAFVVFEFGAQPKTVITREYPADWSLGDEPYYTVNDEKNNALYARYAEKAAEEQGVYFGGRLGEYKYYDMDKVIASALDLCGKLL